MLWWSPIDDIQVTRQVFENASTKQTIYFLCGMSLLSGILALTGIIQLNANPNILNQIPEPIALTTLGVVGFAFFFPWFAVMYFARHFLLTIRQLQLEIERLRNILEANCGKN